MVAITPLLVAVASTPAAFGQLVPPELETNPVIEAPNLCAEPQFRDLLPECIEQPEPDEDEDDDGSLPARIADCFSNIPPNNIVAQTNCVRQAILDDVPPIPDPCEILPSEIPGC